MRLIEIAVNVNALRAYAEQVVKAGGVRAVWLIGSAAHSADPRDIDLLYVLDYAASPQAQDDDPNLLTFVENHTQIEHDAYDSFYKAGNTWWHLSWGAAPSMIRNDAYALYQRQQPKIILAGSA